MDAKRQSLLKLSGIGIGLFLLGSYLNHAIPIDLLILPNCMSVRFGHVGGLIVLAVGYVVLQKYRLFHRRERKGYDVLIGLALAFFSFMAFFVWLSTFIVQNCPS